MNLFDLFPASRRWRSDPLCVVPVPHDSSRQSAHYVSRKVLREGDEVDKTTVDGASKLGRLTVVPTAALVIMQTPGFSVVHILAAGGIGGKVVGFFAAKDIIANFLQV
ncbi:MAG: hypothetical protein IPI89_12245 [Propionivibrio sp.]|nr:hypothetical protein [Propionivibrio sp.]